MNYAAYLRSSEWRTRRNRIVAHYDNRCAICYAPGPLEVHHRTYDRIGNELDTDLIPLCPTCHELVGKRQPVRFGWLGRISSAIFEGRKD